MYCTNCGKEIDDKAVICVNCGVAVVREKEVVDNGGLGWGVLGFFIPIVGLVLFLVWKNSRPKSAKAAGIGALALIVTIFVLYSLWYLGILP